MIVAFWNQDKKESKGEEEAALKFFANIFVLYELQVSLNLIFANSMKSCSSFHWNHRYCHWLQWVWIRSKRLQRTLGGKKTLVCLKRYYLILHIHPRNRVSSPSGIVLLLPNLQFSFNPQNLSPNKVLCTNIFMSWRHSYK